jgi:hypothetical protein
MQKISFQRRGLTFIEAIIAMVLLVIFSSGIFFGFQVVLGVTRSSQDREIVTGLLNERAEFIRNLSYASIGVVGGVPPGVLAQTEQYSRNGQSITIQNYVRNIDDPFDSVLGGVPNDTAPGDYKLIELRATCTTCKNQAQSVFTFRSAPKNLESTTNNGSLFINVIDASGAVVSGATVTVQNTQASPTINLTDVTNLSGVLQLVDTPTSTLGYQVFVSKSGFSSEQTYPPGLPANPNPAKLNATVQKQQLTSIFFQIDKLGLLALTTSNNRCVVVPNTIVNIDGSKLIGTSPNIKKYSSTSTTNSSGAAGVSLEWDTYALSLKDASHYLAGLIPYGPLTVNPSSTLASKFIVSSATPGAVLVDVTDALSGAALSDATVNLQGGAINKFELTGYGVASDTDWSPANFFTQDGSLDVSGSPGILKLLSTNGTYPTSTYHSLISNTLDLGDPTNSITAFDWQIASQPNGTNVKFQLATSSDNATWNFIGPDLTPGTYFTSTSTLSGFTNARYLRYEVFLETDSEQVTPQLDSVTFTFKGGCVPPNQVLFSGLPNNTYTLTINAAGHPQYQTNIVVGQSFQEVVAPI